MNEKRRREEMCLDGLLYASDGSLFSRNIHPGSLKKKNQNDGHDHRALTVWLQLP